MSKHVCPICGFKGLQEAPYGEHGEPSYEICDCCGFEFGFEGDNNEVSFKEYRTWWIAQGSLWFKSELKPKHWDYKKQLNDLPTPPQD